MNAVAKELRELAAMIEEVTRESAVASIAWEQVRALCDYLQLRAHVMELETRSHEESRASEPRRDAGE